MAGSRALRAHKEPPKDKEQLMSQVLSTAETALGRLVPDKLMPSSVLFSAEPLEPPR